MKKRRFQSYFLTAVYVISGNVIGVVLVIVFALYEKLNASTPLLWSFAFMVMGGLLGFVFSVPKIMSDNPPIGGVASLNAADKNRVEENTNLTQISDWLTKILIGAGLVEIKEAPRFVLHVAKIMGQGMRKVPAPANTIDAPTIMCAAIILYFLTWGFISGYLVMKLVLTPRFAECDD